MRIIKLKTLFTDRLYFRTKGRYYMVNLLLVYFICLNFFLYNKLKILAILSVVFLKKFTKQMLIVLIMLKFINNLSALISYYLSVFKILRPQCHKFCWIFVFDCVKKKITLHSTYQLQYYCIKSLKLTLIN